MCLPATRCSHDCPACACSVFDLWEKREVMGAAMRTALDTRLRNHHAFVAGFQVLSLTIPTEIQSAIEVGAASARRMSAA